MEKELTSLLIGLLILFIIYLFIQNSSACSIVHRNKKEEFNVGGRMTRRQMAAAGLGVVASAVIGTGAYHLSQGDAANKLWVDRNDKKRFNREIFYRNKIKPGDWNYRKPEKPTDRDPRPSDRFNTIEDCYVYCDKDKASKRDGLGVLAAGAGADHHQCYEGCKAESEYKG